MWRWHNVTLCQYKLGHFGEWYGICVVIFIDKTWFGLRPVGMSKEPAFVHTVKHLHSELQ
jgi:hypothetical protein